MKNYFNKHDLKKSLLDLKIKNKDIVFIHSSLKTLGKYKDLKNDDLLKSIKDTVLEIIGVNGTLIVPTFNFDFTKGIDFDIQNSQSQNMGVFAEYIRNDPKSNRTSHPLHSISILGKNSKKISDMKGETEFSEGSAFDYILKKNCKIIFLGESFVPTFFHMAEEKANVKYRFWKEFKGNIVDNGNKSQLKINFFARNLKYLPYPKINKKKLYYFLKQKGILQYQKNRNINVFCCESRSYVKECYKKILYEENYFFNE